MLREGEIVAGRYKLHRLIGEGAMGEVWRAQDQTLRRLVAIKFLFVRGARDPGTMVEQFLREARIAASVQHRNVIHTVDFGTVDAHQPYMVMELLDGLSLADRMERDPPLSLQNFVQIVSLTLRGLGAVHDAGIVHRDLKPANIFLQNDVDGTLPKILDFGISRSLESKERKSAVSTQQGMILGTPDYMSPEQARGEADIDKRADIYSMGAILYEGLTGQLPFTANTIGELIAAIVTQTPPPIKQVRPEIPELLSDVVEQAMARNREERFIDARVMRNALMTAASRSLTEVAQVPVSVAPERQQQQQRRSAGVTHARASAERVSLAPAQLAVPSPEAPRTPEAMPAAAGAGGWGRLEGLRSSAPAGGPRGPHGQSGGLELAAPVPAARGSLASVPANDGPMLSDAPGLASARPSKARQGPAGPPSRKRKKKRQNPEAPRASTSDMMSGPGRAGLDSLRSPSDSTADKLEIDYQRGTEHARKKKRPQASVRRRPLASRRRGAPIWVAPLLLLLLVGLLVAGPQLVLERLANSPALGEPSPMESPSRMRTKARRRAPARHPPALRDVFFE